MSRPLIALALLAALPAAAVADVSFYFGAGAGGTRIERSDKTVSATVVDSVANSNATTTYTSSTSDFQGNDLGYRVFAGARIGRYLGLEGGYVDLQRPEKSFGYTIPQGPAGCTPPGPPPSGDCVRPIQNDVIQIQDQITGWEAYAIGNYPFAQKWEVFAKVGLLAWKDRFTAIDKIQQLQKTLPPRLIAINISPASPVRDDGVDLAFGAGVDYRMSPHFTLRGQGTYYDIKNTNHVWMIGFDVIYGFKL